MRRALVLAFTLVLAACGSGLAPAPSSRTLPGQRAARAAVLEAKADASASSAQRSASVPAPTECDRALDASDPDDAPSEGARTVRVELELSRSDADAPILSDATRGELLRCVAPLSPDVEGHLLLRLEIGERPAIVAVTVAWDILPATPTDALPDALTVYADAVDCIEATLVDSPVPPTVPAGEAQLDLQLAVTTAAPATP